MPWPGALPLHRRTAGRAGRRRQDATAAHGRGPGGGCGGGPRRRAGPRGSRAGPDFVADFRIFFGNLHAHTSFSDGSGAPDDAYRFAREDAGLDFLALTEHNHRLAERGAKDRTDGVLIATNPALYEQLQESARQHTSGSFVALWGQEFSTISSGNHVNVFGALRVIDDEEVPNGDFREFYEEWLEENDEVQLLQFNHPWDGKQKSKNYGRDDFHGSYTRLRRAAARAALIEVINGPGTKNQQGLRATVKGESYYREYLRRGFRLAPTADQDNHYRTWGTLTGARTGVLARELTPEALTAALASRRCFASTDATLRVWFGVNGAVMGSEISTDSRDLAVFYRIEDPDEPDADYAVTLVVGNARYHQTAPREFDVPAAEGDQEHSVTFRTTFKHTFLYLKITQWPGQSARRDRLLTSPVWVVIP